MKTFSKKQQGLSLIELMIALVISLFLIGGVVQVYISNKTNYRFGEAMAEVQENGRFALEILSRDIRLADFWGCAGVEPANVQNLLDTSDAGYDPEIHEFDMSTGIGGEDGTGVNGSDALILRSAYGDQIFIDKIPAAPSSVLSVPKPSGLEAGDIVILSDCTAADIFQVTSVTGNNHDVVHHDTANNGSVTPGNDSKTVSKIYGTDAQIMKLVTLRYFIQDGSNGMPALFREVDKDGPQELVSNVGNMQVLYGEDTDNDRTANRYVPAVTGGLLLNNVVSLRISLLMYSEEDNVVDEKQKYTYNGQLVTATDKRMHKVFTSTISVRNRTL